MSAVTHVNDTASTANGTSYASGSFTPPANGYLVVVVAAIASTLAAPTLTASANGLTFERSSVQADTTGSSGGHLYVFAAEQKTPGSPSAMTVTFDCTGDAAAGCFIFVESVTSMFRFGAGAGEALLQVGKVDEVASGTAPTVPFGSNVLTANPTIFAHVGVVATGVTPPSGMTERADDAIATPAMGASIHTRDSGFTGSSITLGSAAGACCAIAIEIDTSNTTTSFAASGTIACTSALVGSALIQYTRVESFETGTNGVDYTPPFGVGVTAPTTLKYSSAANIGDGALGVRGTSGDAVAANNFYSFGWVLPNGAADDEPKHWTTFTFRTSVLDANTPGILYGPGVFILIDSSFHLQLADFTTVRATTSTVLAANTKYTVAVHYDLPGNVCKMRLYSATGVLLEDETTLNGAFNIGGDQDNFTIRRNRDTLGTVWDWDRIGYSNVDWIGPPNATLSASGTIAVVSGQSGNATKVPQIAAGTIPVVSGQSGNPTRVPRTFTAAGTIPVLSALSGDAVRQVPASGTIPVVANLVGDAARIPFAPFVATGTITIVSALVGNPTRVTLVLGASGTIPVVSGQAGTATAKLKVSGTIPVICTLFGNVSGTTASASGTISIVSTVSGSPEPPPPNTTLYRLVLPVGRDDHQRPHKPMWERYHYQPSQLALLLYRDGTVIPTWTFERPEYLTAEAIAGGGRDSQFRADSWEAAVLTAAGYTLELVT